VTYLSIYSYYPQGMKSDVRTSSGMFLSSEERKYPIIEVGIQPTTQQTHSSKVLSFSYQHRPLKSGLLYSLKFLQKMESSFKCLGSNLKYETNQFYRPHHDYFSDTFNLKRGGQRVATMLMYLSDDVEGGETYFPMVSGLDGETDPNSLHGGCAVLGGEKWSATKWMRQKTSF
ncbi:hypothetical protein BHE74_00017817, partial [Ensete ventricosum]